MEDVNPRNPRVALSVLLIVLVCGVASCSRSNGPGTAYHSYGIRHAVLHFEFSGITRGTEDLFIDSFGVLEARDHHTEMLTPESFRGTITYSVRHGAEITIVDSVQQQIVLLHDKSIDSLDRLSPPPSADERFSDFFKTIGYRHVGDTMIHGLPARIWDMEHEPSRMFEWHGVVVATRIGPPQYRTEMNLVVIDTVTPADRSRFAVPQTSFPAKDLRKEKSE